ncbi:hypothetical protein AMS68_000007 [Peltaster fructicola]|uniref:Zn(2)-C6 fungal-type domain-containing protein n=1 Tax=Peltaster fructicola TaxID=286661 RepID=A0A6H0XIY2_9PEZI|nr:hypothetical protein AMS68_000007 [Peltaster fructicola]
MLDRNTDTSKVFACTSCTRRKVRCDKAQPTCASCTRLKLDCQYEEPVAKKRKREPDTDKLEQYEQLLREHNLLDEAASKAAPRATGRLISTSGNHRYVESTLWRSFARPEELAEDPEEPSTFFSSALLGVPQAQRDLTEHHPSQADTAVLWHLYKDRVDAVVKLLHIPTAELLMAKTFFTKTEECLIFAIYSFAVSSLTEAECMQVLHQDRNHLVTLYRECLNQALLNADFLRTTNLQVAQALMLLLTMSRGRTDAQLFWILVGVVIRIAQRMGLHRDGSLTGLNPFDTEMHRRLFWQLPALEGFAAQFAGIGASSLDTLFWDTKKPLNINDADIWPGMTEVPIERKGATEMIFLLVRSCFSSFYKTFSADLRTLESSQDEEHYKQVSARIDGIEDLLESQYLRYCDPMEPLHFCVSLMARVALQASRFRLRMPWAKLGLLSAGEKEEYYKTGIEVLDRAIVTQTNPQVSKYHVHTNSFVLWDILIYCVTQAQHNKSADDPLWSRLAVLYKCQAHLLALKLPIAIALSKHVLRAWDAHKSDIPEPEYIAKIRASLGETTSFQELPVDPQITMEDVQDFDWKFWEQLIRDPDSLAVGSL